MSNLRFGIVGYGRMGRLVEQALSERKDHITRVIDPGEGRPWNDASLREMDSAICFTSPDAGYETSVLTDTGRHL